MAPSIDPQLFPAYPPPARLYSRLNSRYEPLVSAVEADLLRLFLVTAHKAGRPDKMADFFRLYGPQLISSSSSSSAASAGAGWPSSGAAAQWQEWFLLPYLQHPEKEQRFQVTDEQQEALCDMM